MMQLRRLLTTAVVAAAAVAAGAPAAHASTTPTATPAAVAPWPAGLPSLPFGGAGSSTGLSGCGPSHGSEGQAGTGTNEHTVCTGAGLVFIGPSTNVSSVVGPTILSPGFAGLVVTANGPVAIGP